MHYSLAAGAELNLRFLLLVGQRRVALAVQFYRPCRRLLLAARGRRFWCFVIQLFFEFSFVHLSHDVLHHFVYIFVRKG